MWKYKKSSIIIPFLILFSLLIFSGFKNSGSVRVTNLSIDKLWQYKTLASVFSTPAIADINNDGNNDIIINSTDGKMYLIDGRKSQRLFFFETENPILSSPVILERPGNEKWIILAGEDRKVYAIDKNNR